jgi:hypothetical protein
VLSWVAMNVATVPAVVKQMEQGASGQEKIRKGAEEMRTVLCDEEECRDRKKNRKHNPCTQGSASRRGLLGLMMGLTHAGS